MKLQIIVDTKTASEYARGFIYVKRDIFLQSHSDTFFSI